MKPQPLTLVITSGEPAGIGPDIVLTLMHDAAFTQRLAGKVRLQVLGGAEVFAERAALLGLPPMAALLAQTQGLWQFQPIPMAAVRVGQVQAVHAEAVLAMIDQAVAGCLSGRYAGMVTAPLQKSSIIAAGFAHFQGHTEYLAERCAEAQPERPAPQPLMMLTEASAETSDNTIKPLRVCLLTTHVPLARVSTLLADQTLMLATAAALARDLPARYGIHQPVVAVLGVNPHAGENGKIGNEEQTLLAPFIAACQQQFPHVTWVGPVSADTAFIPQNRALYDAYLGAYHDQVLPVFKALTFGGGVNVTLGLPIVRTSVDHGTALSLAGSGQASTEGLKSAILECCMLAAIAHEA